MNNISTEILILILIILFLLSAFFSGSETALMSINKYKMRHQAKLNNKGAKAAKKLLENPDKIIGVILLGNNLLAILPKNAPNVTPKPSLNKLPNPDVVPSNFSL